MLVRCRDRVLDLNQPLVMGILNVTPDSFSDGGIFLLHQEAINRARVMVHEGAAIIDIGGESTRPGAAPVEIDVELDRVIPVIEAIAKEHEIVVSIDTSKPEVMQAAITAGATMINDVFALRKKNALRLVADSNVAVCLMHMQGTPLAMQNSPNYKNVVEEVKSFLRNRVKCCLDAGISVDRIIIDPGFGFGKTLEQNLQLFRSISSFLEFELPLLIGVSRKSFIGTITGRSVLDRTFGSVVLAALAVRQGATIIRAHDVAATLDAIKVSSAVSDAN